MSENSVKRWEMNEVMLAIVGAVLLVMLLGSATYRFITDCNDKRECNASGGKVEHYDDKHDDYWRCVKSSAEHAL